MGLWDSMPYVNFHEMNLDWVLLAIENLNERLEKVEDQDNETVKKLREDVDKLQEWVAGFDYENLEKTVREMVAGNLVTGVYFGLTDSGYFAAYVPKAWAEILFKTTGLDFETELQKEYGHIVVLY